MLQHEIRQILTSFSKHAYHVPIESGRTLVVQIVHNQDQIRPSQTRLDLLRLKSN